MKRIIYNYCFEDAEFGTIYVREKQHVTHIIGHYINNDVLLTVPIGYKEYMVRPLNDNERQMIRNLLNKTEAKKTTQVIDQDFKICTDIYEFSIVCDREKGFHLAETPYFKNDKDNVGNASDLVKFVAILHCPKNYDFNDAENQKWLEKVIFNSILDVAKPYLNYMIKEMSRLSGITIEEYSVGQAHTNWGVCRNIPHRDKVVSPQRPEGKVVDLGITTRSEHYPHKIILSAYTALLPKHLTKLIILHELSHVRHPDHSPAFHQTVDILAKAIIGKSETECERELKNYNTNIYSFSNKKSKP